MMALNQGGYSDVVTETFCSKNDSSNLTKMILPIHELVSILNLQLNYIRGLQINFN